MSLIDEARFERDQARMQAERWHYIATLLALDFMGPEYRWPKKSRDIGRHYLMPEEMKAGALKVTLMEAPEPAEDA